MINNADISGFMIGVETTAICASKRAYQIDATLRAEKELLIKRCAALREELRALRVELANMRLNRIHTIRGEG